MLLAFPAMSAPVVRVGVYQNAPKVFTDEAGKPAGIFIEIIEGIAAKEGWTLKYVSGTWREGLDRLENGEIDLMPDVAYTAEREKIYDYHREPVLSDWFQIYAPKDSGIKSIMDLDGKQVVILDRSIQQEALQNLAESFGFGVTLIGLPDYQTIFKRVAAGDADAAVTNRFYGIIHAQRFGLEDTAIIFSPTKLFFAASKGSNEALLNAIDENLAQWKQDPASIYYRSLKYWTSEKVPFALSGWLKAAAAIMAVILLASLAGSIALKHQVTLRTRELALRNTQLQSMYEEIKHAEQSLRASEHKYRELVEQVNCIILRWKHDGQITFLNDYGLRFFGYTEEEIIGRPVVGTIVPDVARNGQDLQELIAHICADPAAFEQNVNENVRRNGERVWIAWTNRIVWDANDQVSEILSVGTDITARRQMEEALRQREEQFGLIMANLADMVAVLDLEGNRIYNSPSYSEILGNPEALRGTSSFKEIHPEDTAKVQQAFRDTVNTGKGHRLEYRMIDQYGNPHYIESQGSAIRNEKGEVIQVLVVSRDITERHQAEDAIRELNASLERRVAERTAELAVARDRAEAADRVKSAFLATMSHELRTPLNSIIGFTGIILQELAGPLNEEQRKQLEMVRKSARHLLALINDVLDISKIEAGQLEVSMEPFDLRTSISKVVGIIKPLADKKGLALKIHIAPEIDALVSDERRVEQVLLNLLNNAIKFTNQGAVTLRVNTATGEQSAVNLCVEDTGMGIKPENLAILFQPFKQIDSGLTRNYEGTGLGLAICRRLAALLGGEIRVRSEWGKGSVFTLSLPMNEPARPQP